MLHQMLQLLGLGLTLTISTNVLGSLYWKIWTAQEPIKNLLFTLEQFAIILQSLLSQNPI